MYTCASLILIIHPVLHVQSVSDHPDVVFDEITIAAVKNLLEPVSPLSS